MKLWSKKLLLLVFMLATSLLTIGAQAAEIGVEQGGDGNAIEFIDGDIDQYDIDISISQLDDNNLVELSINSDLQAFIEQAGVGGVVSVETNGGSQAFRALQEGTSNSMGLILSGANFEGLFEQSGTENSLSIEESGVGNEIIVNQSGDLNTIEFMLSGSDNLAELTQSGSGNMMEIDQDSSNLVLRVNQTGNNGLVRIN